VVRFYNKRGTAEQWIKEGKQVQLGPGRRDPADGLLDGVAPLPVGFRVAFAGSVITELTIYVE
jgi:hypothetical protein